MRKLAIALLATTTVVVAGAPAGGENSRVAGAPAGGENSRGARVAAAGHQAGGRRVHLRGAISVRVPAGWHLLHGWLSDVIEPIPRLAIASFPLRLSRHTCECGMPNVVDFPRAGGFLFIWETPLLARGMLRRTPRLPVHLPVGSDRRVTFTCQGPSATIMFQVAGRAFEAELYLGPAAATSTSEQLVATINRLRIR